MNFFWQHFMEGHAKTVPISRLPLITILDTKHYLRDVPVCQVIIINCLSFCPLHIVLLDISLISYLVQPFHLDLNFFNKENRVLHYPVRTFYVEGSNLMAYNLSSGVENVYKKLYPSVLPNYCFQLVCWSSIFQQYYYTFETDKLVVLTDSWKCRISSKVHHLW